MPLPLCECIKGLPQADKIDAIYCALLEVIAGAGIDLTPAQISGGGGELTSTVLFVGNSIGTAVSGAVPYPSRVDTHDSQLQNNVVNNCVGGQSLATLNTNFATFVAPYAESATGLPLIVFLFCPGGVDLLTETAAQVNARIATFVTAVHNIGGKVVISTVAPGVAFAGAPDVQRLALNVIIEAVQSAYDFLVPLARLTPDFTDTAVYLPDQQHYANGGHEIAMGAVLTVLFGPTFNTLFPSELFSQITLGDITAGFKYGGMHGTGFAFGELAGGLYVKQPSAGYFHYNAAATVVTLGITDAGVMTLPVGTSNAVMTIGGSTITDTTQTGNVGAGEDTLMSNGLPTSFLAVNGNAYVFMVSGTIANNANAKRIRVKWGATTIFDTGAAGIAASNAMDWKIEGKIVRTGAATQKCTVWAHFGVTLVGVPAIDYTTAAETLSGAVTFLVTGEAVSNNDIVKEVFKAYFEA